MSLAAAFDVPIRSSDPAVRQFCRDLLDAINARVFNERCFTVSLQGQRAVGAWPGSFIKGNTTTFEDWYAAGISNATALTTAAPAIDTLIAVPFIAPDAIVEAIGFEVTTVSGANGKARAGIYAADRSSDGLVYPGSLILDLGDTAVSGSTGHKTLTGKALTLDPGSLYFAAYLAGVAAPTIRTIPVGGASPFLGFPSGFGAAAQLAFTVASTYSVNGLPSAYPTGATAHTTAIPAISFRFNAPAALVRTVEAGSPDAAGYTLMRARMLSPATIPIGASGPYFTVAAAVRRGTVSSVVGTFDSRTNGITAGKPFHLTGATDVERALLADDVMEVKVTQSGRPLLDLSQIRVQFDALYSGA